MNMVWRKCCKEGVDGYGGVAGKASSDMEVNIAVEYPLRRLICIRKWAFMSHRRPLRAGGRHVR